MISGDIKFSQFFDSPKVLKKVKDGTESALSKAGAFVRQRAKTSIRKRKKISIPGSPPSSHVGQLRDLIFFGYDSKTESVVIGPKLFKSNNPMIPKLLEFGGTSKTLKGERAKYHAFPFMQPALDAEQAKFADCFRGAIK